MKNLYSIKGKIIPSYQCQLSMVRKAGYDYKVLTKEPSGASIEWFSPSGKSLGISKFDAEDATKANLAGGNWVKYRATMMFSKAVSQGVNTFCPDVFDGPIYTPEDFDVVVADDGEVVQEEKPEKKSEKSEKQLSEKTTKVTATLPAAAAKETTATSTAAPVTRNDSAPPPQEIEDADIFDVQQIGQPGQEAWVSIEQAGVKKGWDAEVLENWVIDKLLAEGILKDPPTCEEDIYTAWSSAFVNSCLEFVNNNAQPAG